MIFLIYLIIGYIVEVIVLLIDLNSYLSIPYQINFSSKSLKRICLVLLDLSEFGKSLVVYKIPIQSILHDVTVISRGTRGRFNLCLLFYSR